MFLVINSLLWAYSIIKNKTKKVSTKQITTVTTTKFCHEEWCFSDISGSPLELYIRTIWYSQQCALCLCCDFYTCMLHSQLFFFSLGDQINWVICSFLVLFSPPPMPWQKSFSVSQISLLTRNTSYVNYWWCAFHTLPAKATAEESNNCNGGCKHGLPFLSSLAQHQITILHYLWNWDY